MDMFLIKIPYIQKSYRLQGIDINQSHINNPYPSSLYSKLKHTGRSIIDRFTKQNMLISILSTKIVLRIAEFFQTI